MKLLVDMDGVLADFEKGFNDRWKELFPDAIFYEPHERTTFYLSEQYGPEYKQHIEQVYSTPGFFRNLEPVPDCVSIFHQLVAAGHDLVICTAPLSSSPTCMQEKYDWVSYHLGGHYANHMIISKDKTMIMGDFLIDDRPIITGRYTPVWKHVVFHQTYNQHIDDGRLRMRSWQDGPILFSIP